MLVLQALQDSVTSNRQGIYDHAWQEGLRLSYSNELVNTKIYRLIMDFEAEDTAYLMQRIERNEAFRRRSSRILGGVAIGAVVLMLLFVGMLWRDIKRTVGKSRGRFVSIVLLMALGAFALVGLNVAGPDMRMTSRPRWDR